MSISTSCAQLLQLSAIKGLGLKTFIIYIEKWVLSKVFWMLISRR